MRVDGSRREYFKKPYRIIVSLITIWSFLCSFIIFADTEITYSANSISPPSRFSSSPRIIETGKGFRVVQDGPRATKECKKETLFTYVNLLICKALNENRDINSLKKEISSYRAWHINIEKIPKEPGIFLSYQKSPKDKQHILHYFLNEKDSYTGRAITISHCLDKQVYIESMKEADYKDIKNTIKVLFSPEGGCENEIINAIDCAEKTFDAAIYSFTNPKIFEALKSAKLRGVAIRLLLNGKRDANKMGKELEKYGIKVKYYYKKGSLMHNKFAIIDEDRIFTGSYNWTELAEKENRENLIMLPYVAGFRQEFDYLWENKVRPPPRAHSPPLIKAFFSPRGGCEEEIIKCIQKVKNIKKSLPETPQSIKIALYYFTSKKIAKELFDAKEAGVDIEIVLDKTQKSPSYAIEKYFKSLQKKFHKDNSSGRGKLAIRYYRIPKGMMHNKFAIIGDTTITGSYNWTESAESKNRENMIILPGAVKDYNEEFVKKLWAEAGEEVVIDCGKLGNDLGRAPPHETLSSHSEYSIEPINITKLVEDTKKTIPGHPDPDKTSGLDPPILDSRTGETLSIDELNRRIVPGKDRSCFWSGRTEGLKAEDVVEDIAMSNSRITLGTLLKEKFVKWPECGRGWEILSGIYAKNSEGIVYAVLGKDLRPGNVWDTIEEKTLRANKKVVRIIVIDPKTKGERIIWAQ